MLSRPMHGALALVLVLATTVAGAAEPPSAAEIAKAVEQLADDDFRVREAASVWLWKAGHHARAALETSAKGDDVERAQRAESILARMRLGILPDTPPEVMKLIHQFRDGSSSVRRRVIQQLSRTGKIETGLALLRYETDDSSRRALVVAVRSDINKVWEKLLAEHNFSEAEKYLELAAVDGPAVDNFAVFLTMQGRADAYIERLRKRDEHSANNSETLLLTSLLKVKGDLAAEYSIEPGSRALRGEVPPIKRHGGQPLLEEEAFSLQAGELSGVIPVGKRFVLLLCERRTKTTDVKFEQVEELLHEDMYEKRQRIEMGRIFRQLQEQATVDNFLAGTSRQPKPKRVSAALPRFKQTSAPR